MFEPSSADKNSFLELNSPLSPNNNQPFDDPLHPFLPPKNSNLALWSDYQFQELAISGTTDTSLITSVQAASNLVREQLAEVALSPEYDEITGLAFGENYNQEVADSLRQSFAQGDLSQLPNIQIISSDILGNANGAYAEEIDTIFLSDQFVQSHNTQEIAGVLTEEIGHYIDDRINTVDAAGDEGDIFSRLVQGESLSGADLALLKEEDDSGFINLNDRVIAVEFQIFNGNDLANSITGTSYNDVMYGYGGNDYLNGGLGDDRIYGGAGNDVLDGGYGFDYIDGGTGIDKVTYAFYNGGIALNLQTGVVSFPGNSTRTDTVVNIENVTGSQGNDTIIGNNLNNSLDGGLGNDTINAYGFGTYERDTLVGGAGSDTFLLGDASNVYYAKNSTLDYATIADFNRYYDKIQLQRLSGSIYSSSRAYGYSLVTSGSNTELRLDSNNELIATINGVTGLSLTTSNFSFVGSLPDYAGNSLSSARDIGTLNSSRSFSDWVGSADTNDYYRFTVNGQSNFSLDLTGLTADADVQLLNSSGSLITSSSLSGSSSESINRQLGTGTYYVRVLPFNGANTNYSLNLSGVSLSSQIRSGSENVNLWLYNDTGRNTTGYINPNRETVVIIHGWESSDQSPNINKLAKEAAKFGTQVLALD